MRCVTDSISSIQTSTACWNHFSPFIRREWSPTARAVLDAGRRSVRELFASTALNVGVVDRQFVMRYDRNLMSFFNVNTPDDLIMARLMMHVREKSLQEECV